MLGTYFLSLLTACGGFIMLTSLVNLQFEFESRKKLAIRLLWVNMHINFELSCSTLDLSMQMYILKLILPVQIRPSPEYPL